LESTFDGTGHPNREGQRQSSLILSRALTGVFYLGGSANNEPAAEYIPSSGPTKAPT